MVFIPPPVLKATVIAFIGDLSDRKWDSLPGYFTSDANWWTSGNPDLVTGAGTTTVTEHLPLLSGLADQFTDYSFDIVNIVGDTGRVMLEAQAKGLGPQDLVYINNITMSLKMTDAGKIADMREYPDHVEINWLIQWFQDHQSNSTSAKRH
ncbi:Uu.00g011630.m01.CDS01 [Anthostomella pinea]|uniref:Uu.00g011630.m01.CDS01 n=1 Tax=Anthostomella pinea TaxID=933095 RepID=A0AAI8VXS5_9PEZI|nr:Uu.00g011630.m01.CDS01 [Anthostomella pinea]